MMKMHTRTTSVLASAIFSLMACLAAAQNITSALFLDASEKLTADSLSDTAYLEYGVFTVRADLNAKLISANNLKVDYIRETQLLSKWNGVSSTNINFWKTHKKKIVLNINNDSTPSPFPTNLVAYADKLRSFLNVYGDSIELAVIENEELNKYSAQSQSTLYHLGSIQDYIRELEVAVNVCQEKGVAVTNGGLTNPIVASLKHYYSINGKKDSLTWLTQQMNGVSNDSTLWQRTDSLLIAFRNIPLTYVNLHWFEPGKITSRTTGVLQVVCNYITQQTGKKVITNETGVKTTDSSFVTMLLQQWDSVQVDYCIFLDGTSSTFGTHPLTIGTGDLLANGIAFRNFIAGTNSCEQSIVVTPAGVVASCDGNNIILTASSGFDNYLWSTGDTSQSISVGVTDNYSVTSILENCMAFSNAAALTINPLPVKPVITTTPSPPVNICPSKNAKLISPIAKSYLWSTGEKTKTVTVNKPGSYFVTVSDSNGCKNTSDFVTVTYQSCNAPGNLRVTGITAYKATLNWDTASCAIGYQFQYHEKGSLAWTTVQVLSGSTSYRFIYNLKPATTYEWRILTRCRVSPDTLLSVYALGTDFTTSTTFVSARSQGAEDISVSEEKVFPVPAKNVVTVTLSRVSNDVKIELTDLHGKVLWQSEKVTDRNTRIPVSGLARGIYLVIIKDKEHNEVLRVIKD